MHTTHQAIHYDLKSANILVSSQIVMITNHYDIIFYFHYVQVAKNNHVYV